ncbi:MAG: single-stranded-DNA-specific exonuclease RecJ [Chitinophagia bacterium]|nr:single-stranded-DNA-specific exonuclease RecJ [Chitinophagia bacterium]
MEKRWSIITAPQEEVDALQSSLQVHPTICRILVQRGIHSFEAAKTFFRPQLSQLHDPFLMKDMHKAVDRIIKAFAAQEKILIYGDYDVDGTTAVASMFQFIRSLHPLSEFYIPHRYREGYGLSQAGIDYAAAHNFSLIITLDCGIKSVDLIQQAADRGIDCIVCDHHLPDAILPPAYAILNPKQIDCPYPFKELCGCGVGFKLMTALAKQLQLPDNSYLQFLDLVVTAIAADIVPINGENRILAYFGMKKVNENPCSGIKALLTLSGVQKSMHIQNLVFIIAPRINAAGRMDDAQKAVQLFLQPDEASAMEWAEQLQVNNTERREADSQITIEALELLKNDPFHAAKKSTLVYRETWHKGVVGIVASRLIETYYRPTIVLTKSGDYAAGSARSVAGFNLYEAIHACREWLLGYGGHFAAAGLTLLPEHIDSFSQAFENAVAKQITPEQETPEIKIDATIQFADIKQSFFNILQQMEPFGPENMRPVFLATRVRNKGYSKLVKDQHIKFSLSQQNITFNGIGFNMAHLFQLVDSGELLDVVFTIDENEYNGNISLQLKVLDVKPHSA